MSRYRMLTKMIDQFAHHVRVVDMSPSQWILNHNPALSSTDQQQFGSSYFDTISSFIHNGNESIIEPQLQSHEYHIALGSHTLRTFTEYITPSLINNPEKLEHILKSSIYTGYHLFDQKANTFEGIFGGVKPIEIAATIGTLLSTNHDKDSLHLISEYKQILDILAPCSDILWIQNINNLLQLQIVMDIAKIYKDDEQIWINVDSSLLNNGGHELFDFFMQHNPGAIIVVGNDWKDINKNLVLVREYTSIEGGTKFGVIVDNKEINRDEGKAYDVDMDRVDKDAKEGLLAMDKVWKAKVTQYDSETEWNDELLNKASMFWIEQGVSIIGCEWETGLKIVKNQAAAWNSTIG